MGAMGKSRGSISFGRMGRSEARTALMVVAMSSL